jgi:hypothetical protein
MRSRRGPKGYQRSDDRLREEVIDKLLQQSDIDLDQIEVTVMSGNVTLSGEVDSRRTKHNIEDIIDSVWGVKEITNNLKVVGGWGSFGGSSSDQDRSNMGRSGSSFYSQDDQGNRQRGGASGSSSGTTGSSSASGGSSSKPR